MNPTLVLRFAVLAAVLSSSFAPAIAQSTPQTPSQPRGATTFFCGKSDNNPATLVRVGDRTLQSPLIVWTSTAFGNDYSPQQRCQTVSERIANAVEQNNGRLQNLRLAIGKVNAQTVICYTNGAGECTADNLLFTLKPENARNPQVVLARLYNFGRMGRGEAVYESGGVNSTPTEEVLDPDVSSVSLEEAIDRALAEEAGTASPQSSPESQPSPAIGI